jgi:hypothetical protein
MKYVDTAIVQGISSECSLSITAIAAAAISKRACSIFRSSIVTLGQELDLQDKEMQRFLTSVVLSKCFDNFSMTKE